MVRFCCVPTFSEKQDTPEMKLYLMCKRKMEMNVLSVAEQAMGGERAGRWREVVESVGCLGVAIERALCATPRAAAR